MERSNWTAKQESRGEELILRFFGVGFKFTKSYKTA